MVVCRLYFNLTAIPDVPSLKNKNKPSQPTTNAPLSEILQRQKKLTQGVLNKNLSVNFERWSQKSQTAAETGNI